MNGRIVAIGFSEDHKKLSRVLDMPDLRPGVYAWVVVDDGRQRRTGVTSDMSYVALVHGLRRGQPASVLAPDKFSWFDGEPQLI